MSFTESTLKIHALVQNILPPPYFVDRKRQIIYPNKTFYRFPNKILRSPIYLLFLFLFPLVIGRLSYLFVHWKSYSSPPSDEVAFYGILVTAQDIVNANNFFVVAKKSVIEKFMIEILKVNTTNDKLKFRPQLLKEMIAYNIAGTVPVISIAWFVWPLVCTWDPLQLCFGPRIAIKLIAALSYGIGSVYVLCLIFSVVLLFLSTVENLETFTKNLYRDKTNNHRNIFSRVPVGNYYLRFQTTRYLVTFVNELFCSIIQYYCIFWNSGRIIC